VGLPIVAAAAFSGGSTSRRSGRREGMPAPRLTLTGVWRIPAGKSMRYWGEGACPTFFRGGSRAGAGTYPAFDAKMGGIGVHLGSV